MQRSRGATGTSNAGFRRQRQTRPTSRFEADEVTSAGPYDFLLTATTVAKKSPSALSHFPRHWKALLLASVLILLVSAAQTSLRPGFGSLHCPCRICLKCAYESAIPGSRDDFAF